LLRIFTIDVPAPSGTRPVNGDTPNSICITPGPNQVMFVGEITDPGRLFKVSLDGKVLGVIGPFRAAIETVLRRPAAGVPLGDRNLCR
jgi:hypothetical protein